MSSRVDPSTLGWVKSEIDTTLEQARGALESYAENTADSTRLRFFITHVHQVTGTLQMVELDGAALLSHEIEILAEAVLDEKVATDETLFEILSRALITLSDYLDQLLAGHPDVPLRLLPLLNRLRAARNGEIISEVDLFNPDLSVYPPSAGEGEAAASDGEESFARLRARYQKALLAWLRDNDRGALATMHEIVSRCRRLCRFGSVAQLWWMAEALFEGLEDQGLDSELENKKLLVRLDLQLGRMVREGEAALVRNPPDTLVRKVLYRVGRSGSEGSVTGELRDSFELASILPAISPQTTDLEPPATDALKTAGIELVGDIERAQEQLGAYFDPDRGDVNDLEELLAVLNRIASTLETVGTQWLKVLVNDLIEVARGITARSLEPNEQASLAMAGGLLQLENCARDLGRDPRRWGRQLDAARDALQAVIEGREIAAQPVGATPGIEISEEELTPAEFQQLLQVVATEVEQNLQRVEEAIESFAGEPEQPAHLDEVPRQLGQIQGAMQMLGQERAADLISMTRGYLEELHRGSLAPDHEILDAMAMAVGTVDAYMDGLKRDRSNLSELVDRAMDELDRVVTGKRAITTPPAQLAVGIREEFDRWITDTGDRALLRSIKHNLRELCAVADRYGEQRASRIGGEITQLLDMVSDDLSHVADDVGPTLRKSVDRLVEIVTEGLGDVDVDDVPPPAPPAASNPAAASPMPDFVPDPDILVIFLEEAREVLDTFAALIPQWDGSPQDDSILAEIRRGFHTLKGSGRLAGATDIGELAWIVEDVLNRCLKGAILHSRRLSGFVSGAAEEIGTLVGGYESGERVSVELDHWRAQSAELLGKAVENEDDTTPAASASLPSPVTVGIFCKEARGHVETLGQLLEMDAQSEPDQRRRVYNDALRALHTLEGSARSVGLRDLAQLGEALEGMLTARSRAASVPDDGDRALVGEIRQTMERVIEQFERDRTISDALVAELNALTGRCGDSAGRARPAAPATAVVEPQPEPQPVHTTQPEPEPKPEPASTVDEDAAEIADLNAIFVEEAVDVLDRLERGLQRLRRDPTGMEAIGSLKRSLHTLKGSARTIGANAVGDLSHNTESLLEMVESGLRAPGADIVDLLEEVHDTLVTMIDRMQAGGVAPSVDDLASRVAAAMAGDSLSPTASAPEPVATAQPYTTAQRQPAPQPANEPEPGIETETELHPGQAAAAPAGSGPVDEVPVTEPEYEHEPLDEPDAATDMAAAGTMYRPAAIRVNPLLLDNLSNYAGEVSIARSRIQQQVLGFKENLKELRNSVSRFRDQIRDLEIQAESQIIARPESTESEMGEEFDPLEFDRYSKLQYLSRSLAESLNDLATIQSGLDADAGAVETALQQQARLNTELQEGLMKTRLVAFSTQVPRLRHTARQIGRELGKKVELEFSGAESEIDRNLLERMLGPLEHMVRNAIDHGIEDGAGRRAAGKPETGHLRFDCRREGNDFVIRLSDDGRGLDLDAIRRRAVQRKIIQPESRLGENDLYQLIMMPGFTTREEVTQLSGRGVGMDVVHNEVRQLGGRIGVESRPGQGAAFTIHLPLSLSVMQALVIRVADQPFAIPVTSVINILKVRPEELGGHRSNGDARFDYQGRSYVLMDLRERLGFPPATVETEGKVPLILARAGDQEVMLQVDQLLTTQEIVVKPVGPQIAELQGIEAATVLGDGSVVLILDVGELWVTKEASLPRPAADAAGQHRLVLVVDDSLTVRTVTDRSLRKHGMEVLLAKDGVEAVEKLRDNRPDVMLVDIEMPRMDGYELTSRVRSNPDTAHIPIIIITSRAGAKHKQKAMELGANRYLTKPYQEDALIDEINSVLAPRALH